MYLNHFALRSAPFAECNDPRLLWCTPELEEVLAAMEYEVHFGGGIAVLTGDPGTGKTLLARALVMRLHASDHAVVLSWSAEPLQDLTERICRGFGVTLPARYDAAAAVHRLRRQWVHIRNARHRSILIIDQAENLDAAQCAQLETLIVPHADAGSLLAVVLVGRPGLLTTLNSPLCARLRQRLANPCEITALSATETNAYLRHRLRMTGAVDDNLFDSGAAEAIHAAAGGTPRLINHLAEACLVAAYGAGQPRITTALAEEVTRRRVLSERSAPVESVLPAHLLKRPSPALASPLSGGAFNHGGMSPANKNHETPPTTEEMMLMAHNDTEWDIDAGAGASLIDSVAAFAPANHADEGALFLLPEPDPHAMHQAETTSLVRNTGSSRQNAPQTPPVAAASTDELQARIDRMLRDAERRVQAIEARAAHAAEGSYEVVDQVERVDRACERAELVESRLGTFAEHLGDNAEQLQERCRRLMTALEGGEETQSRLRATLERAANVVTVMESRIDAQQQRIAELEESVGAQLHRLANAQTQSAEAARTSASGVAEHLHALLADADQALAKRRAQWNELESSGEERLRALNDRVTQADQRIHDQMDEAVAQLEIFTSEARTRSDQQAVALRQLGSDMERALRQAAEKQLSDHRRQLEEAQRASANLHREQVAASESQLASIQSGLERARQEADQARAALHDDIHQLQDQARQTIAAQRRNMQETADAAAKRFNLLDSNSAQLLKERTQKWETVAGTMAAEAGALHDRLERMTTLKDDTAAAIAQLQTDLEQAAQQSQVMITSINEAQDRIAPLIDATTTAESSLVQAVRRGEQLVLETHAAGGQVEALRHSIGETLVELGARHAELGTLRNDVDRGAALLAELSEWNTRAADSVTRTREAAVAATCAGDTLRGMVDQTAAAQDALQNLSDANAAAHRHIERLNTTGRDITESTSDARADIERLTAELRTHGNTAHDTLQPLREIVARAEDAMAALQKLTDPAVQAAGNLQSQTAAGNAALADLSEQSEHAARLAEHLAALAPTLEGAAELGEGLQNEVAQAGALYDQLTALLATAAGETARLEAGHVAARELCDRQDALQHHAATATAELTRQINDAHESGDRCTEMITELIQIAQSLEQRAGQLEETIAAHLASPEQIVADARAQAEHLERVCSAVRKVFAQLAQSSLDARKHSREFDEKSTEARESFARVTAETAAVSGSLQQWVAEAVRAQERLQHLLARTPGIAQTHPPTPPRSGSSAAVSRMSAHGLNAELSLMPGVVVSGKDDAAPTADPAPSRAQQIARMIEEARQAAANMERATATAESV